MADRDTIQMNLDRVRSRIAAACARSARSPDEVTLIAVTKSIGLAATRAIQHCGVRHVGENRVRKALEKARALEALDVTWHFIGHLQRNKAGAALERYRWIHSVESDNLVSVLQKEAEKQDIDIVHVFIEVNIAGERQKYGVSPGETRDLVDRIFEHPRLRLEGFMTMAPWSTVAEDTRPVFRGLRELRDRCQQETGKSLPHLSMGMSNDFDVAVEEGATMIRIGSALFEGCPLT